MPILIKENDINMDIDNNGDGDENTTNNLLEFTIYYNFDVIIKEKLLICPEINLGVKGITKE